MAAVIAAGLAGVGAVGPMLQQLAIDSAANTVALAALAPLPAAVAALTIAVTNLSAQVAALSAQVALLNAPALAAGAAAFATTCARVRADNAHDRRDVPLIAVPHSVPVAWPVGGFGRADLIEGPIAAIDALLGGYGLPAGPGVGGAMDRRNALAAHLGTKRF